MSIEILKEFFFWCIVINFIIYTISVIALLTFRSWIYKIHEKFFGLDQQTVARSIQNYLANYKLLTTFFNFVPWLVLVILS